MHSVRIGVGLEFEIPFSVEFEDGSEDEDDIEDITDGIGSLTFKLGGSLALWILDGISRLLNLMDLR
ncbi:hypothetical protein RclHR1_04790002 [Rhizophagus clarus]|uniref:Uncharacterized protein n=1 Tax=Rhizophagus clarus TaxID=94130 RepID=A0A2Z6RP97_9GLOM|nr:hypothetical protein RclHR1_04790002 [Rhizophagus clarus]